MALVHDGTDIPLDPALWDADGTEFVSFTWADQVAGYGAIQTSTWVVPTGWSVASGSETSGVTVTSDGVEYTQCTRARLSTTLATGIHTITNRVTFQNGTSLDRSIKFRIGKT